MQYQRNIYHPEPIINTLVHCPECVLESLSFKNKNTNIAFIRESDEPWHLCSIILLRRLPHCLTK